MKPVMKRFKASEVEVNSNGDFVTEKEVLKRKDIQSVIRIKEKDKAEEIAFYLNTKY